MAATSPRGALVIGVLITRHLGVTPTDSPRAAVPMSGSVTGTRMPGSLDEELDDLIYDIHRLGVKDGD